MVEDKLTHDERLRLECIAQSIGYYAGRAFTAPNQIIATAAIYEEYVVNGRRSTDRNVGLDNN